MIIKIIKIENAKDLIDAYEMNEKTTIHVEKYQTAMLRAHVSSHYHALHLLL